ncbi:MAG: hypothetical protein KME22_25460 [Hassallia sp. WJT32-NPBG1]|jgi:hypothetical protein|nr:hypothetical protein [Hassallia sp. WJT32-NPBG1]
MTPYQVVIKRIVSPDGKIVAEAKSVAAASGDNQSEISQSVSVHVSSGNNSCRSFSTSSSTSYAK